MRTTNYLKLSALVLCSIFAGCSSNNDNGSTGPGGVGGGGAGSNTGGASSNNSSLGGGTHTGGAGNTSVGGTSANKTTTGGSSGTSVATGGAQPTGGSNSNPAGGAATGGNTGTGGSSSNTPTGGAQPTGGSNSNPVGGAATGGKTGSGGTSSTSTGVGGAATGGTTTVGGSGNCTKPANLISDFEDTPGKGTVYPFPTTATNGYWYTFSDSACSGQVPANVTGAAVNSAALPTTDSRYNATCNKYAMHSSISGCPTYSGFGAELHPASTDGKMKGIVDLSAYDGVTFWLKAGSAVTNSQLYVEFQTKQCVDAANGGTSTTPYADSFNCHGHLITNIPSTWTQVYVPFKTTGLRWFPLASTIPGAGTSNVCDPTKFFCEAPQLDPSQIVDIQFALEDPFDSTGTAKATAYDVWIDDLALYKFSDAPTNSGLGTWTHTGNYPFPADKSFAANCPNQPTAATGKVLQDAYLQWKSKFVVADGSNFRVISPEIDENGFTPLNPPPTVSEGMGYGMLLAVYTGDKPLFDGLLGYWKAHPSNNSMLMTWKINGNGGSGSAIDADEDVAFALQMARKQWGSAYDTDASTILSQILSAEVDSSPNIKPGNQGFGDASQLWNPSYFAPAYYKYFADVADTAHASTWNSIITNGYKYIASITGSTGLVPAWCTGSCQTRGGGGYTDSDKYQYDAHRTPFRIGLDACWNGNASAKTYLNTVATFFANKVAGQQGTAGGGLSILGDVLNADGSLNSDSSSNSMSIIGSAGVGAMASSASNAADFTKRVWAFLLEGHYTQYYMYTNGDSSHHPGYTYYNATVGLMTAFAMSGNFYVMQ